MLTKSFWTRHGNTRWCLQPLHPASLSILLLITTDLFSMILCCCGNLREPRRNADVLILSLSPVSCSFVALIEHYYSQLKPGQTSCIFYSYSMSSIPVFLVNTAHESVTYNISQIRCRILWLRESPISSAWRFSYKNLYIDNKLTTLIITGMTQRFASYESRLDAIGERKIRSLS